MPAIARKTLILFSLIVSTICHAQTKPAESADTSFLEKGDVDTSQYISLPYWDTTLWHSGSQGYKDTFSVAGASFRMIHNDTLFDGILEKFEKGNWVVQWIAGSLGRYNDYERTYDLNSDGYKDFIFYWRPYGEVYFFNPARNTFSDTVNCLIDRNWWLLESSRNIYYEVIEGKLISGKVESNLFTFNNTKRIDLLTLILHYDEDYNITGGIVQTGYRRIISRIPKPKEPASLGDFNYPSFWKKQYKYIQGFK